MGRRNILEVVSDEATRPGGTVSGWNELALRASGTARALRSLALLHTCMYNAWAAYDDEARQTALGVAVRLPRAERDAASKTAAMSHAARSVLGALFPERQPDVDARMARLGLAPADAAGQFSPAGIGRTQAAAMLDVRHRDQPFALMPAEVRQPLASGQQDSAAHWWRLARHVSERAGHDDDRDVLLFFVLANALADAAIAAGDGVSADAACAGAAAEVLRRFTGGGRLDAVAADASGQALGRKVGARVFDKARRYRQGKL
jgi:hypothetical protein